MLESREANMTIRDFVMQDFAKVMEINDKYQDVPAPKSFVLESIEKGHAWVSEENGEVIGFIIGKIKHGAAYINNVTVEPAHRGKGIATKLIKQFESVYGMNQKPENIFFWLQVDANNPAQKLYFDLGYRVYSVDENYYGKGKHAICMAKSARPIWNVSS